MKTRIQLSKFFWALNSNERFLYRQAMDSAPNELVYDDFLGARFAQPIRENVNLLRSLDGDLDEVNGTIACLFPELYEQRELSVIPVSCCDKVCAL